MNLCNKARLELRCDIVRPILVEQKIVALQESPSSRMILVTKRFNMRNIIGN